MKSKYVSFEMNHIEECDGKEDDSLYKWYIDGYTSDENEEGTVIAVISVTKHGDVVLDWHDNAYRLNEDVLRYVEMAKIEAEQYK